MTMVDSVVIDMQRASEKITETLSEVLVKTDENHAEEEI